jgi:L-ascorbate metabolism protein UlaG (beta-lactamase superfamily)
MKLTWLGHSAFRVETEKAVILIDPFLTGNPGAKGVDVKAAVSGVTHVALTHGHGDHVGDTVAIAKETGATVIANFDLCQWLASKGLEKLDPCNSGGTLHHDGFSATLVNAVHSSAHFDENGISHSLGSAGGLVFHFDGGSSLFHMGDTDIFSDMALINELHQPQIGIVPIGDRFTMGGAVAALACRRYFKFETILPAHYASFGMVDQTADVFLDALEDHRGRAKAPRAGELVAI